MPTEPSIAARPSGVPPRAALDLLDESFHRLRLAPSGTLGIYYAGTLPFVLALLYFCVDQSHNPDAARHATGGGLLLTGLFLLMKICQAVFTARLAAPLRREGTGAWNWARLGRLAFIQTVLQPPGLFVLAFASVVVVPLGWTYAFYQNVTVFGDGGTGSLKTTLRRALHGALRQPGQNHAGLSVLSLLGLFVTLNLVIAVFLVPHLLKMFTGEENLFTRAGWNLVNTTLFAVVFGLVYLALDPVAKAFYTLRCFYEDSLHTGEDFLSELAALPPPKASASALAANPAAAPDSRPVAPPTVRRPRATAATVALILLAALCLSTSRSFSADATATAPPPATRTVSPPELRRSIDDVLRRRQFAWREPRKEGTETGGALDGFFKDTGDWLHARSLTPQRWLHNLSEWVRHWKPSQEPEPEPSKSVGFGGLSGDTLRTVTIILVAMVVGLIAFLSWRQWRTRRARTATGQAVSPAAVPVPDLADDGVLASQLPEDEWLRLAQKLLGDGERRLALRAFYLSALSNLAARGLLVIARHKSNRDYLLELRRRARTQPELPGAFGRNVARFERVWYGSHPADDGLLAEFQADREQLVPAGSTP